MIRAASYQLRQSLFIALLTLVPIGTVAAPENVSAFFRDGQTFLTWDEDGSDSYRIYRHRNSISPTNLSDAELVATVDSNSSKSLYGVGDGIGQTHWIIDPIGEQDTGLGTQLRDDQGLFVHTVKESDAQSYYVVVSGDGQVLSNSVGPVAEKKMRIQPIPIYRVDGNSDSKDPSQGGINDFTYHTTYAWFMDYSIWNHEWEGYIFNFIVSTPKDLESRDSWSIMHRVDGKGTRLGRYIGYSGNQAIGILNESVSPSYPKTSIQDWHYGHVNSTGDSVVNYTEHRNILSILFVIDSLRGDRERVWGYGHSMGGSGSLSLGMRYPSLFSMIYGCQPATDYGNPEFTWHGNVSGSYGTLEQNLPIVNLPFNRPDFPELDHLTKYNGTPVFDWQNPRKQLELRVGDDMALLCLTHGRKDESIDWETQGRPFLEPLLNSKRPFKYIVNDAGHNWQSFNAIYYSQLWHNGQQYGTWFDFPISTSMPGFSGIDIADDTVGSYLYKTTWEVIQDEPGTWEMAINTVNEVCNITPRRCQNFYANPGDSFDYYLNDTKIAEVIADQDGLVTAMDVDLTENGIVKLINTYRAPTSISDKPVSGTSAKSLVRIQTDNEISVQYTGIGNGTVGFTLFDTRGRVVGQTQKINSVNGLAKASWSGQAPGVYLVHVAGRNGTVTEKIVWR